MMTAISVFSGAPQLLKEVAETIENDVLPELRKQSGFLGTKLYRRRDGIELVQCTDWDSLDAHDVSSTSAEMAMVGRRLMELLDSGSVELYVDTYEIAATA